MTLLFGLCVLLSIALPLVGGLVVSYRGLPRDRHCPLCGADTYPLQDRLVRIVVRAARGCSLQRRWCAQCAWSGYARLQLPAGALIVRSAGARLPARGCRTEPLRDLCLSGERWRVLVQRWEESGWHYGRLLFVGPAGRVGADSVFSGPTRRHVLDQALALSDPLLACRLKSLASD